MTSCLPGTYNSKYALSTACPDCPSGFYCPNSTTILYDQYVCTTGHWCGAGSITPTPCDPGGYSNVKGNTKVGDCLACTAGSYCGTSGLTVPTGLCSPGYYCSSDASSAIQPAITSTGGPCTAGHYCLEGTGDPSNCPKGTYMTGRGSEGNVTYQGRVRVKVRVRVRVSIKSTHNN
jgi:hypothetical protein